MSITDILNTDTIIHILDYLKDYDKMNFMKTCKEYYCLRNSVNYTDLYESDDIKNLSFNNKFKRLIYRGFYVNDNMDFGKCEKNLLRKIYVNQFQMVRLICILKINLIKISKVIYLIVLFLLNLDGIFVKILKIVFQIVLNICFLKDFLIVISKIVSQIALNI
nr:F-box and FNIP repeat domain containing protein [Mimivirus sp.]